MDIFKAISDPKRREMISFLANNEEVTISSISEHFSDSRQAVTKHLGILNQAGLISIRKDGRNKYCQLNLKALEEVKHWVDFYHNLWEDKLKALETYLNGQKH